MQRRSAEQGIASAKTNPLHDSRFERKLAKDGSPYFVLKAANGGVGGNIAGALLKKFSLGPVGNTIVGLIGGGLGQQLLSATGLLQSTGMVGDIGGSVVGGGILMTIVGLIKNAMANKSS